MYAGGRIDPVATAPGSVRSRYTFDDPQVRLPLLDGLEEFQAGRPSLYYRVLLAMKDPVWAYIGLEVPRTGYRLADGQWPPRRRGP